MNLIIALHIFFQQSTVDAAVKATAPKPVKLKLTRCGILLGQVKTTPSNVVSSVFGSDHREVILIPIFYVLARKFRNAVTRLKIDDEGHFKNSEIIATTMVEQQMSREKEIYMKLLEGGTLSSNFSSKFQKTCDMTMVRLRAMFEAFRLRANQRVSKFELFQMQPRAQETNTNRFVAFQRAVWINYYGYELHLRHETGLATKMNYFEIYSELLEIYDNNLSGFPSEIVRISKGIYTVWDTSKVYLRYPTP